MIFEPPSQAGRFSFLGLKLVYFLKINNFQTERFIYCTFKIFLGLKLQKIIKGGRKQMTEAEERYKDAHPIDIGDINDAEKDFQDYLLDFIAGKEAKK